jgi:tetratricopeptide (TPR) repeat protein
MPRPPNIPQRKLPTPVKSASQENQLASLIAQGLALHHQGKFNEAKAFYEKVLGIQKNNFGALQLLGALSVQTKP